MILKKPTSDLIRGWKPAFGKYPDHDPIQLDRITVFRRDGNERVDARPEAARGKARPLSVIHQAEMRAEIAAHAIHGGPRREGVDGDPRQP
jgi:hypothetical protein